MAEPNRSKPRRKQGGRSQPITRHPLFAAIVALWFAALLGLASLALSAAALESVVLASRIDALIPAAAPPLGATARLLLASVLGLVGGAIGWSLAKRASAPSRPAPQVLRMADVQLETLPWPGMAEAPAAQSVAEPLADPEPAEAEQVQTEPVAIAESPPVFTAAERIAAAELESLSHVELVERLAIALQRRQARLGEAGDDASLPGDQVVRFRGLADRQVTRPAPPSPAARAVPEQTERALREALATLQRMSGSA